jgi:hypothetical protein
MKEFPGSVKLLGSLKRSSFWFDFLVLVLYFVIAGRILSEFCLLHSIISAKLLLFLCGSLSRSS